MVIKTIGVLTSGGDSPGMNSAIRAIAKVAAARGVRVLGIEDGFEGLIEGRTRELTRPVATHPPSYVVLPEVDSMGGSGGTLLGSSRSARFKTKEGRAQAAKTLSLMDGLIVIGGNGSLAGAHLLFQEVGARVIGVPASIDNDIGCTATAIGVDTALNTIIQACDRISDTARAHRRAFVVEVMGRQCGYLAMASAVAAGADAVLFREQGRGEASLVEEVAKIIRDAFLERGKRRVLVIKAEGVEVPSQRLVEKVQERLAPELPNLEIRATVLGHLVRGGNPTYQDRMVAGRLAFAAAEALIGGGADEMVAWTPVVRDGTPTNDSFVQRFPLERVLIETERLLNGTSDVTQRRLRLMEVVEGVLPL